ncbi:bifunctional acetaldehyde-CoA/alcohol dehydrogenase [Streptomyces sp. NPDC050355]|uniref:bifunctional acetaldehyde-CoA/alcohol dehydrogenase n=1 Tax=Streptomyces sp. NPDC050355 TaxID=3365609 RepID=UPI0037A5A971
MTHVDILVQNAQEALEKFELLDQRGVDRIVAAAALAALGRHMELARMAVQEIGHGVVEDKAAKNMFACEHVTHHMSGLRTVGVVRRDELAGIVEIAAPVGVVCAVTPVTNPTSTVIFKSLIALKTRNPVVFSFPRAAHGCSAEAARTVRDAAVAAGAPEHCVQWIDEPSRQAAAELMAHDGVALILATGGNDLVRAAYSAGKPAIGVGAGNVPVLIDHTADLERAAYDIVLSKSFDHGLACASEQTLVVLRETVDAVLGDFRRLHAHIATAQETALLERYLFGAGASGTTCAGAVFNTAAAGRSACWIAEQAGFSVPEDTSIIVAEVPVVGPAQPLTLEKLCPVLALVRADDRDHAARLCDEVLSLDGLGHSAAVHTRDEEFVEQFGMRVKAVRVVWNSPSTQGAMGGLYNAFTPSLTLGCGSYGRTSISGNVHAVNLLNIKRIGRRTTNLQWFKVPPRIYFEPHSLRYLAQMRGINRATLVTGPGARGRGHVQRVLDVLGRRPAPVTIDIIDDIEAEPGIETVRRGAERLRTFQPDTVIALGGGSVMDAAKVMWLLHEHPDLEFTAMREKFLDIRKRVFTFPEPGARAKLVCVPTTAGSGAEVTPFAVITDPATGLKYPLADYALTPSVAICDPTLTSGLPAAVTADVGFDALTHAVEAYVSVYASDFTDGLCLNAITLVFDHLERAVRHGPTDPGARMAMHNAATIAGMAIGNAFLGIVHAMAHTLGSTFRLTHGRTNAILLPHAIRYNGTVPGKLTGWPKYERYRAPERFQQIARHLGLPAATPGQAVEELASAVEDLRDRVGIEPSFQAAGIDERTFLEALPQQTLNAFNDQCAPANPRAPLLTHIEGLMRHAYYGSRP